ncbi:uncharacterized protein GGS25DRAFT_525141 [Hypoxylon fragiforme]|uniref:uncharacterized protein n=1 Tax=Hypoxylon fragiforme TaxID=63214 RepID=UPI0020C6A916|nr:uncharacterized protein GGS25DRAFT_525141 [Hypoxylon fragiforme]KAI2603867.1 hypothetical protein GGS25DRAFT_525141 [Hypoxylon fragiforme]
MSMLTFCYRNGSRFGRYDNVAAENRLKPRLDLNKITCSSRLLSTLPPYLPSLKSIGKLPQGCAFVAVQNKSSSRDARVADIGLALLPRLENQTWLNSDIPPSLSRFVMDNRIPADSLPINGRLRDEELEAESFQYPHLWTFLCKRHASLELSRFGSEREINIEGAELAIQQIMKRFRELVPNQKLVLVTFGPQKDFERMNQEFPYLPCYFDYWTDVSALLRPGDKSPANNEKRIAEALRKLHYPVIDAEPRSRHRAANDAVRTLAVLDGLINPKNVSRYRFDGEASRTQSRSQTAQENRVAETAIDCNIAGPSNPPSYEATQQVTGDADSVKRDGEGLNMPPVHAPIQLPVPSPAPSSVQKGRTPQDVTKWTEEMHTRVLEEMRMCRATAATLNKGGGFAKDGDSPMPLNNNNSDEAFINRGESSSSGRLRSSRRRRWVPDRFQPSSSSHGR